MSKLHSANILICGVGGQGVLLLSDILSQAALTSGYDVKKSEVHGMAQRGGSVTSHVRYGARVYSPLIEEGTADVLVALEQLEVLRYLHYLSRKGQIVVDSLKLKPMPVLLGAVEYPADVIDRIRLRARKVSVIEAFRKAQEAGQPRVQNVIVLGALSTLLEIPPQVFEETIQSSVRPRFAELNLKAFQEGRELMKESKG